MLRGVIYPPVQKTGRILNYSLLLLSPQRVYLLAKTVLPPSAPLPPFFGSTFMLCIFAYQRGAPFSPHPFAENDNLITMDIVNN